MPLVLELLVNDFIGLQMPKNSKVLVVIDTTRIFGRQLLRGIGRYSQLHGPWFFYTELGIVENPMPHVHFDDLDAEGIIAHTRNRKTAGTILSLDVPTIIGMPLEPQRDNVIPIFGDWDSTGSLAAEHLLERGFTRFGYFGSAKLRWSKGREAGFRKAIERAGYQVNSYDMRVSGKKNIPTELKRVIEWLKMLTKPVGIMAGNDDFGQYLLEACARGSIRVPEEVAVVSVDNDELICNMTNPPLSSIETEAEKAGYEAAELLDEMMAEKTISKKHILVSSGRVTTRHSSDILAIQDIEVTAAVRFIRTNFDNLIQVGDVVEATNVSRRVLQQRFKKILGHSIHEEIRRSRIDQAGRMLIETTMPISEIAYRLGYVSVTNFARYFNEQMHMTPREYRNSHSVT